MFLYIQPFDALNKMLVPSAEQQQIVDAIASGANVAVDAVAGSGKTTTVLAIAASCESKVVFQITFNSQLKSEVRSKVVIEGLGNLHVHTYHSLATTFYDRSAYTDAKIICLLNEDKPLVKDSKVDILIIDEAQDMTMLYFKLVNKFVKDVGGVGQIVVLGDRYQGVYEFMKADTRFLTLANEIWAGRDFVHLSLQESYRVTRQIAWFINNVMLNEERIISKKDSKNLVEWYVCSNFSDMEDMFLKSLSLQIKMGKTRPDEIFVLAASLKSGMTSTRHIENFLVRNKIPVYVPISDDGKMEEDVVRGKVVFSSLPSSKGRERNIVILTGFDQSYFDCYAKTATQDVCPSTLYVATTRAKKRLILVSNQRTKELSFLNSNKSKEFHDNTLYMNDMLDIAIRAKKTNKVQKKTSVTNLVKFLTQDAIEYLTPLVASLVRVVVEPRQKPIAIPCKLHTDNGMCEDVSHLNGLAIPTIWETRLNEAETDATSTSTMFKLCIDHIDNNNKSRDKNIIAKAVRKIAQPCKTNADFLYLANVYWAINEGYHGQLAQIKKYTWLEDEIAQQCINLLEEHVGLSGTKQFEVDVGTTTQTMFGCIEIGGAIDIMSDDAIWEVKCTDTLQLEHMLQLIVYAWLYQKHGGGTETERLFKIINIRTGEVRQLVDDAQFQIQNIVDALFNYKYKEIERSTDEEFIERCRSEALKYQT